MACGLPGLAAACWLAVCAELRLDHGFQRFALVLHVGLGRFDQVRDQVVAPLQLHVDLRERVLEAVPQADQLVVDTDEVAQHQHGHHAHADENRQSRTNRGEKRLHEISSPKATSAK